MLLDEHWCKIDAGSNVTAGYEHVSFELDSCVLDFEGFCTNPKIAGYVKTASNQTIFTIEPRKRQSHRQTQRKPYNHRKTQN